MLLTELPASLDVASRTYDKRGWTTFERCSSELAKSYRLRAASWRLVIDVSATCEAARRYQAADVSNAGVAVSRVAARPSHQQFCSPSILLISTCSPAILLTSTCSRASRPCEDRLPTTPERMRTILATKSFTNGSDQARACDAQPP